jgi:hypothetical protein
MTLDDLKKLATGSLLFSLNRIITPRLVTILYLLGLAAIVLWAISHFFVTFGSSFGEGLWGLIEIVVFGLLGFIGLRIVCEAIIVFFEANGGAVAAASQPRPAISLIDEVRDAIEELAEADATPPEPVVVKKVTATKAAAKPKPKTTAPRGSAKRTPAKPSPTRKS